MIGLTLHKFQSKVIIDGEDGNRLYIPLLAMFTPSTLCPCVYVSSYIGIWGKVWVQHYQSIHA